MCTSGACRGFKARLRCLACLLACLLGDLVERLLGCCWFAGRSVSCWARSRPVQEVSGLSATLAYISQKLQGTSNTVNLAC